MSAIPAEEVARHWWPILDSHCRGSTHYAGCELNHWACAIRALIEDRERLVEAIVDQARDAARFCDSPDETWEEFLTEKAADALAGQVQP